MCSGVEGDEWRTEHRFGPNDKVHGPAVVGASFFDSLFRQREVIVHDLAFSRWIGFPFGQAVSLDEGDSRTGGTQALVDTVCLVDSDVAVGERRGERDDGGKQGDGAEGEVRFRISDFGLRIVGIYVRRADTAECAR